MKMWVNQAIKLLEVIGFIPAEAYNPHIDNYITNKKMIIYNQLIRGIIQL